MKQETKDRLKDWYIKFPDTFDLIDNIVKTIDFKNCCPEPQNILKPFYLCDYNKLNSVIIGQSPYNNTYWYNGVEKLVATGLPFGNNPEMRELSPSLAKIQEEVLRQNHIFLDKTLESWAEQGVLMLNWSLTIEKKQSAILINPWKSFIEKLLLELPLINPGLPIALVGSYAHTFEPYIKNAYIFKLEHPSYACRQNRAWDSQDFFLKCNDILKSNNNITIAW